jgi:hypothetical protein
MIGRDSAGDRGRARSLLDQLFSSFVQVVRRNEHIDRSTLVE